MRLEPAVSLTSLQWVEGDVEVTEVVPQPPLVFLLAGSETRFFVDLTELKGYLEQVGCMVTLRRTEQDPKETRSLLKGMVKITDQFRPLLVLFHGHGSPLGWEGFLMKPQFHYSTVAKILANCQGPLMVVIDACFGLTFLPHLWKNRNPSDTGFMGAWNGHRTHCGGTVEDILQSWPLRQTPEEIFGEMRTIDSDLGEVQVARQSRWGARLDHLFFSPELKGD